MIKTNDPQEEVITRLKRDLKIARMEIMQVRNAIGGEGYDEIVRYSNIGTNRGSAFPDTREFVDHSNSHSSGVQEYRYDQTGSRHHSQDFSEYSAYDYSKEIGNNGTKYSSDDSFYTYAHPKPVQKGKLATEKKKTLETNTIKNSKKR